MVRTKGVRQIGIGALALCMSSFIASAGLALEENSLQMSSQLLSNVPPSSNVPAKDYSVEMENAEKAFDSEDVVKAIKILRGIAEQNHLPAQVRLGELLDYAEQNEEAVGWYMMAANQGYAPAEHHLGAMYAIGEGIAVNFEKAVYWTRKSADQNYLAAVKSLAQSYRLGEMGLEIDLEQAHHWESKIAPLEDAYKKSVQARLPKTEVDKGKKK